MQKNVASQKWFVFAFDETDNTAKTGDASQITANLRIDGGAADAVDDTNPTELEDGYYYFNLAQGETNGDYILICPASSTGNIQVIGVPGAVWTTAPYYNTQSIDSSGRVDVIKIAGTTQTANDMSGDIDTVLIDTNEIQGKLPTNKFMGSSDGADDNGNIDNILTDTGTTLENRLIAIEGDTDVIDDGTSGLVKIAQDVAAVLVDTGTTIPGTISTVDTVVDAIKAVTDDMKVLDTTIASVDTADTVFRLTAGLTGNDDINNAVCAIYDTTGSKWSGPRKVTDYVHATLQVTIDEDTAFPLAAADRVVIWNVSYATTAAAGSVTQANINSIADQVWNEAETDHTAAGSMGDKQRRSDRTGR